MSLVVILSLLFLLLMLLRAQRGASQVAGEVDTQARTEAISISCSLMCFLVFKFCLRIVATNQGKRVCYSPVQVISFLLQFEMSCIYFI